MELFGAAFTDQMVNGEVYADLGPSRISALPANLLARLNNERTA